MQDIFNNAKDGLDNLFVDTPQKGVARSLFLNSPPPLPHLEKIELCGGDSDSANLNNQDTIDHFGLMFDSKNAVSPSRSIVHEHVYQRSPLSFLPEGKIDKTTCIKYSYDPLSCIVSVRLFVCT